jgi:hypothetical protein
MTDMGGSSDDTAVSSGKVRLALAMKIYFAEKMHHAKVIISIKSFPHGDKRLKTFGGGHFRGSRM